MKKLLIALLAFAGITFGAMAADVPTFPGGAEALTKFINDNMKYPAPAKENGVEGVVTLKLTIKADGTVGSIKIVRMVDPDLEQEAIRIAKIMPAWIPADKDGQPIEAFVDVPIVFELAQE